jgi:hypothetical protein
LSFAQYFRHGFREISPKVALKAIDFLAEYSIVITSEELTIPQNVGRTIKGEETMIFNRESRRLHAEQIRQSYVKSQSQRLEIPPKPTISKYQGPVPKIRETPTQSTE